MRIIDIEWLDIDNKEAIVIVGDSEHKIKCFADELEYKKDQIIKGDLYALDLEDAMLESDYTDEKIVMDNLSCNVVGLLDDNKSVLKIGNIKIKINPEDIPGDIKDGQKISARISRVDLY